MKKKISMLILAFTMMFCFSLNVCAETTITDISQVLFTTAKTPVYAAPDLNGQPVTSIEAGLPVQVSGITADGWYRVEAGGSYFVPGNCLAAQGMPDGQDITVKKEELTQSQIYTADAIAGTNAIRAEVGLAPLTEDATLQAMAEIRAKDMVQSNYFSHYKDGVLQLTVVRDQFGWDRYRGLGENIAYTTAKADIGNRFCGNWKKSPLHYANMVNQSWKIIGISVIQAPDGSWYGVQIFS